MILKAERTNYFQLVNIFRHYRNNKITQERFINIKHTS